MYEVITNLTRRAIMFRWLTFKCKIGKRHVNYLPSIHTNVTQSIFCIIFLMYIALIQCSTHWHMSHQHWQETFPLFVCLFFVCVSVCVFVFVQAIDHRSKGSNYSIKPDINFLYRVAYPVVQIGPTLFSSQTEGDSTRPFLISPWTPAFGWLMHQASNTLGKHWCMYQSDTTLHLFSKGTAAKCLYLVKKKEATICFTMLLVLLNLFGEGSADNGPKLIIAALSKGSNL